MKYTWKQIFVDSIWITIAWEWLQGLLGRAVDFVLWVTMIFACYQLIPGAPIPPQSLSVFMFILQFVALDIGGMGLRQLAQRYDLPKGAFTYKIAYSCIGVTFITLIFAGAQHAIAIPQNFATWVEVTLVIARSGLTVLYGQAIRALKFIEEKEDDRVKQLEAEVSKLRVQLKTDTNSFQSKLDTNQALVSDLEYKLQERDKAYTSLLNERDAFSLQIELKQQELTGMREMVAGGQNLTQQQVTKMQEQFNTASDLAEQRISKLQERLDTEQNLTAKLRLQLQSTELQKTEIAARLQTANGQIEGLQKDLQNEKMQMAKLQKIVENQTAKGSAKNPVRPAKLPANITPIEDAKQRISHAEVLTYIASNPDLKRSEVAANLGISERKVYDAIAWGKEQEDENAASG